MHFLLLICGKFTRAQLAHQIFLVKSGPGTKLRAQIFEFRGSLIYANFDLEWRNVLFSKFHQRTHLTAFCSVNRGPGTELLTYYFEIRGP
jgi:hypothetical protein